MEDSPANSKPVWGAKKAAWSKHTRPGNAGPSSPSSSSSSSPSAFPPLSSSGTSSQARGSSSPWRAVNDTSSSSNSFNPYPTRRQEIAQRAHSNSHRRKAQVSRRDPDVSTLFDLEDEDINDVDMYGNEQDDEDGQVSARGATMSSIVFRDLSTSAATSRSASPWQTNLSPGLAMFVNSSFGGQPLKVLSQVDEELGAAHLGPRIYKRHNQKHVKTRIREKLKASRPVSTSLSEVITAQEPDVERQGESFSHARSAASEHDAAELSVLIEQYKQESSVAVMYNQTGQPSDSSDSPNLARICESVVAAVSDPVQWIETDGKYPVAHDLIPVQFERIGSVPAEVGLEVRRSTIEGIKTLLLGLQNAIRTDLILTLAKLLTIRGLRPTNALDFEEPSLQTGVIDIFASIIDILNKGDSGVDLVKDVLSHLDTISLEPRDSLWVLTNDLIGLCGQQLAANPTVLDERQDRILVTSARLLSTLFCINQGRPKSTRLPNHFFYCTVVDLCPFLEHFIHHASSLASERSSSLNLAEFNICRYPFLLSLGAKVRIMQLENELRLSQASRSALHEPANFLSNEGSGRLEILPQCLKLKVDRQHLTKQSQELLLQLLDHCATEGSNRAFVRPLRVNFEGEHASDGGGPAREWFATVAKDLDLASAGLRQCGWFAQSASHDTHASEDVAAFLGTLLGLAALHSMKVALPFYVPVVAFKIACCRDLDDIHLSPMDLEEIDAALAKSLRSVLEWSPDVTEHSPDANRRFDETFSFTWSTSIQAADGQIRTIDLVPGGRHRPVQLNERQDFVSKLIWRVLIGSVRKQVTAFRCAWQAVMPTFEAPQRSETSSDTICRGGLAVALFQPTELRQAICSIPSERGSSARDYQALDISDFRASTELVHATTQVSKQVVTWFWQVWTKLDAADQHKLLAFITGSQDVPVAGARAIGLRLHLVHETNLDLVDLKDGASWPLPWSSTCTSTLFLPVYPSSTLLDQKLRIAIEHYKGFGLR